MIGFVEWLEYFGVKNIMSFSVENTKYFGYLCVLLFNFIIESFSVDL